MYLYVSSVVPPCLVFHFIIIIFFFALVFSPRCLPANLLVLDLVSFVFPLLYLSFLALCVSLWHAGCSRWDIFSFVGLSWPRDQQFSYAGHGPCFHSVLFLTLRVTLSFSLQHSTVLLFFLKLVSGSVSVSTCTYQLLSA